jgi:predicted ABC-type transport system involved in lysophospholipase L1 biosynthesis ATPase subunit
LTVLENIAFPLAMDGDPRASQRAAEMLDRVGLAGRADHRAPNLSGGEQQRVALARALVTRPAVVLADEPTGNLDRPTGDEILGLLREAVDGGQAVVMVTHAEHAAAFATRTVRLMDGRLAPSDVVA